MTIAGIIAEYNPFHNGHAYQINSTRARGATHVVACMSGNFTQRGECAILPKHTRAKAALLGGADLVVELPLPYAVSSAERFAFGGVSILNALGCVELLSFGSECGDAMQLENAARALDHPDFSPVLKKHLKEGTVFPRARQLALHEALGDETAEVLSHPNNTLGVEYIKALHRLNSGIAPMTIPRKGAAHESDSASGAFASASLLRRRMLEDDKSWTGYVPQDAADLYRAEVSDGHAPCTLMRLERAVLARLRALPREAFTRFPDVTEGLEGRIYKAVRAATGLDELYSLIKSKRYTLSRVRRMVLCAFLGVETARLLQPPPYIRVLGFNARGAEILARAKDTASLPVGTSLADMVRLGGDGKRFAELEAAATDLFVLCAPDAQACGLDFTMKPVIIN